MIMKGLRFGMLLQLAVGPLCFLTFRSAAEHGFGAGMLVAVAVTLADALFVTLSVAGAAALLRRAKIKAAVRWIGCLVLVFFGVHIILSALGVPFLPGLQLMGGSGGSLFWQGFVLTVSNPLTIVFWGGVFTAQLAGHAWSRRRLWLFAAGCVLSTFLSLTVIAALGSVLGGFLPVSAVQILNIAVGGILIIYGVKLLLQKDLAAGA
jgi:threonine/homoserine/homoserine lactone efflux protein